MTAIREDQAAALRFAGKTAREIAEALGVHIRTARKYRTAWLIGADVSNIRPAGFHAGGKQRWAWPLEREAEAIRLALVGLTRREIGQRLGITKNAVIGALDRAAKAGRWQPPTRWRAPESTMAERIGYPDLDPGRCRWIIGDPRKEWHWCGAEAVGTYCDAHRAKMFLPPRSIPSPPAQRQRRVQIAGVVVPI